jgi:diguanylate cyclase (GGDEF)-like protein/PAS domain S-box-containing protein
MFQDNDLYRSILDNLYDGVYFTNRKREILYWNKGAERITGYASDEVVGHSCRDNLLNHVDAKGVQLCLGLCPLAACMVDGRPREAEVFLHHAAGHRVPVWVRVMPLRDAQGQIVGAVEVFSEATGALADRHELRELRRAVRTDPLTGISNRQGLEGRLRGVLAEIEHHQGTAGLLFMDLDGFKKVNDTYGHDVGDQVLRMVAATLRHNVRKIDTVGRWGGEEFVVLLPDVPTAEELEAIAEKLRMLVAHSRLDLPAAHLSVTISVGATLFLPADTPSSVVHRADQLMYRSKRAGGNRVSVG